jgi:hypothetical protein
LANRETARLLHEKALQEAEKVKADRDEDERSQSQEAVGTSDDEKPEDRPA